LRGNSNLGVQTRSRTKEVTFDPQAEPDSGRKRKQTPASSPRQARRRSERQSPREAEKASANKIKQESEHAASSAAREEAGPSRRAGRKGPTPRHRVSKPPMAGEEPSGHGDDAGRAAEQVCTALDCPGVSVCLHIM
jgi:hypothetical protein